MVRISISFGLLSVALTLTAGSNAWLYGLYWLTFVSSVTKIYPCMLKKFDKIWELISSSIDSGWCMNAQAHDNEHL